MSEQSGGDTEHLQMLYPEFVDRAMRSQEPVTEIRKVGEYRRIYSAAQYDPNTETVWRADIDADHHPDYDSNPSVQFSRCYPVSDSEIRQQWTRLATGRLSGPQKLGAWESLFTVFNIALSFYNREGRPKDQTEVDPDD
jgi:hypothetical protein